MRSPSRLVFWIIATIALAGCRRANQVGDHVLVSWRGGDYPAVIVGIDGPAKFHIHYDGFGDDWDEVVPASRIKGRLSSQPAPVSTEAAPSKARIKASASSSAAPAPPSVYHQGDHVRVEWHGSIYPATVMNVLGDDRYRVHYEGYGSEWDEDVPLSRIQRRGN